MKIVCLGNEFVAGDSLAKEVGELLMKEGFGVVNVKDSFELMAILSDESTSGHDSGEPKDFVILDVVRGLDCVKEIEVKDLRVDSILSAHDFDAGFVLGLLGEGVRIVGIPMEGDVLLVKNEVVKLIAN